MLVLRIMVKRKAPLSLLLFFMAGHSFIFAFNLETSGYYENRFFILSSGKLSLKDISENLSLGDYNRLRLQFRSSVSENISLNLAVDFFTFHGIISSPLGVYENSGQSDTTHTQLDRAYIDLYFPGFDITIGKQRVAIGISHLWAPLDLFNRINILEPAEEKLKNRDDDQNHPVRCAHPRRDVHRKKPDAEIGGIPAAQERCLPSR